jgi:hypothetical protein
MMLAVAWKSPNEALFVILNISVPFNENPIYDVPLLNIPVFVFAVHENAGAPAEPETPDL